MLKKDLESKKQPQPQDATVSAGDVTMVGGTNDDAVSSGDVTMLGEIGAGDATMASNSDEIGAGDVTMASAPQPAPPSVVRPSAQSTPTTSLPKSKHDSQAATRQVGDAALLKSSGPTPSVPREKLGPYELLKELGAGGMGKVYQAYHPQLERTVAIKVMLRGGEVAQKERERFLSEAKLTAKLKHPNIVAIHDINQEESRDYIVMDFIAGQSLAAVLKASKMPVRQSLELVKEIALALEYAHQNGIVHRDLKPANIMVEKATGRPIVMDFGLAKNIKVQGDMTKSGEILGTPRYMAPEQAQGRIDEISPRTDIYALGTMLYEMLTGVNAVDGDTPFNIIYNILKQEVIPPRRHNPKLAQEPEIVCLKAMAKEPKERYASCRLLAEDIDRYLNGEVILARPAPLWLRSYKKIRKHQTILAPLATLVLFYLAWGWYQERQQIQAAMQTAQTLLQNQRGHSTAVAAQYEVAAQRLELLAGSHPQHPDISQTLANLYLWRSQWAWKQANYGASLTFLENCINLADKDVWADWAATVARSLWEENDRLVQQAKANLQLGLGQEKIAQDLHTRHKYADALAAQHQAFAQYLNAVELAEQALQYLMSLQQSLAPVAGQSHIVAVLEKIGRKRQLIEQELLYALDKNIGLLALSQENYLLARIALKRCANLQPEKARADGVSADNIIAEFQEKRRLAAIAKLQELMILFQKPPLPGAIEEAAFEIARKAAPEVTKTLIQSLSSLRFEERPLTTWQQLFVIEAMGKLGDIQTTAANNHNSITCLMSRLKAVDRHRHLAEAEAIVWALYRLRAGIANDDPKELVFQVRAQVRARTPWHVFLEKTWQPYRGLPFQEVQHAAIPNWDAAKWLRRGDIHYEAGQCAEAIWHYNQAITKDSKLVQAYYSRAQALRDAGDSDAALRDYTEAIKLRPELAVSYDARGQLYYQNDHAAKALEDFSQAIRLDPGLALAYHHRGLVYLAQGQLESAIRDAGEAIKLTPRFADVYISRAQAREKKGDVAGALLDCAEALRLSPQAYFYRLRGQLYQQQKNWPVAIDDYNEAIRLDPQDHQSYLARAVAYDAQQDTLQALADADEALRILDLAAAGAKNAVEMAQAYYTRGMIYCHASDFGKAADDFTQSIARNPGFAMAYVQRGMVREREEMWDSAIQDYSEALRNDPQLALAHKKRGLLYANKKNLYDKAFEDLTKCLQLNPQEPEKRKLELLLRKYHK